MIWEIADMLYFNHIFVDSKENFQIDEESDSEAINSSSSSMMEDIRVNPYSGLFKYFDNIGKIQVQKHFAIDEEYKNTTDKKFGSVGSSKQDSFNTDSGDSSDGEKRKKNLIKEQQERIGDILNE